MLPALSPNTCRSFGHFSSHRSIRNTFGCTMTPTPVDADNRNCGSSLSSHFIHSSQQSPGAKAAVGLQHGREERLFQPERPAREVPGVAARAEVAGLARKGEQLLVRARVATHAGKPVFENAAREELVGDVRHDGAPGAMRGYHCM